MFFLVAFVLIHLAIWKLWTEDLLTGKYDGGDLARLSYCAGSKMRRHNSDDLPRRHVEMQDYAGGPVDVVTIGDSFSQGGGGGLNRYYQDYIATVNTASVLNIAPYEDRPDPRRFVDPYNPVRTLIILINSGYLDKIRPRYVLLESVQRACGFRLGHELDFSETRALDILEQYYRRRQPAFEKPPAQPFVNNGNAKFVYHNVLRLFGRQSGLVRMAELDRPFFSVHNARSLLFVKEDLMFIPTIAGAETNQKINANLNSLSEMLAKKNIRLYFMPIVDKYDLYYDYITRPQNKPSDFFEQMRRLPKRYVLVDTKQILQERLKNGEKDVYFADDTHWSWKAPKAIFENTRFSD